MIPKSKIPWDNFVMRKFGSSIAKQILLTAEKQVSDMLLYRALGNLRHGAQRAVDAVWVSPQVGKC